MSHIVIFLFDRQMNYMVPVTTASIQGKRQRVSWFDRPPRPIRRALAVGQMNYMVPVTTASIQGKRQRVSWFDRPPRPIRRALAVGRRLHRPVHGAAVRHIYS
ncbi:hypothetical protein [Achromobacter xylosoxidans]|uniref:hypothetical protein n=1 Tax=Alcaligenes xylosoxydans xylosoxydans TaxID=85698 RepID=UPI00292F9143|nr:hypothetical protein [Achromobacter xylosoxidans]WOB77177.1 hypothetical protein PZA07_13745 [Achromobacter xylosoxidans]